MKDCAFCKVASGQLPSHKLYEDDRILVILDIFPAVEGYTLIVPKDHSDYVWDMDEESYMHAMQLARRAALKIKEVFQPKHVGLKVEGTHAAHSHIKVFQFANHDDYIRIPDFSAEPDHEALAKVAAKLKFD